MKSTKLLHLFFVIVFAGMIACNSDKTKTTETDKDKVTEGKMDDEVSKNIEKTKSFYPMYEKGDWAGIEKIVDPGFLEHNAMTPAGTPSNRDSLMKYLRATHDAFPDMKLEVTHAAGTGDMVFVHYRFTGTNTAAFMGMPATNKKVDYTGVDLLKIKDGVAVEHWDYADNITYMRQMGMMPEGQ